jgi:hypothetical protein
MKFASHGQFPSSPLIHKHNKATKKKKKGFTLAVKLIFLLDKAERTSKAKKYQSHSPLIWASVKRNLL